ncbi:STAS domain-containing protein [Blastococcus sp. SYSU DS0510]
MAPDTVPGDAVADAAPFGVVVDLAGGTVALAGEFVREHSHHLVEALAALVGTEHRRWTVDTRQVTLCDAAGLRALVTAHHLARRQGCALVLDRPSPVLHRLLVLVGLDELLEVHADRAAPPPAVGGGRPLPSAGPLRAAQRATTVPAQRRP